MAMKSSTGLFPTIVCDMVRVAEDGGRLDKALNSAASYLERSIELRKEGHQRDDVSDGWRALLLWR